MRWQAQISRPDPRSDLGLLKSDLVLLETKVMAALGAMDAKLELLRRDMTIKLGGMIFVAVGVLLTAMRLMPHP
jgi:hypothetical protein